MDVFDTPGVNSIIYEYVRGSNCHGLATPTSDLDLGGVYVCDKDILFGLRSNYVQQIQDAKSDVVYYEIGRWAELLLSSNPTVLEGLFVDDKYINVIHPAIKLFRDNREEFLSKRCFDALIGYSVAQVNKATGLNKKCMLPDDMERKEVMDFCFVAGTNEDTIPLKQWLDSYKLLQKYCGLSKRTNMPGCYPVFYDFGSHLKYDRPATDIEYNNLVKLWKMSFGMSKSSDMNLGYKGIVDPNRCSNELRLSSIPKGMTSICTLYYNQNSYEKHCREYKDWKSWKGNRNELRYEANKDKTYDAKNMCECIRLIHTGIELARDGEMNIERTWDREFLLDVKSHKYDYEYIQSYIKEKQEEFRELEKSSTLKDDVDKDFVNGILMEARKMLYANN